MSSIFRQLSVEVDRDVAKELGVTFREEELSHKKIGIINKDSLVIRRSFTLRELKKVIEKIAIKAASSNVNETCSWITYQPKVPESVKKLKKH